MKTKTWKKFLATFLAVACLPLSSLSVSAAGETENTAAVSVSKSGNTVTIGNSYISREFSVADNKLSTVNITNKRTDGSETVFTPAAGSEEFKIRLTKDPDFTAPDVPAIDRSGWTATADSYNNATGPSDGNAPNLIDGNLNSVWHSNYGGGSGSQTFPYNVVFTLGGSTTFKCFSYTPRQESETVNGNLEKYALYYSTTDSTTALAVNSEEWILLKEGTFTYDGVNPIYVNLDAPCTATQLKLKAISAHNGREFGGGAEFNLHADTVDLNTLKENREFASSALTLSGEPVVEDTTATINGVEKTGKKVTFNFAPYTFNGIAYTISEVIVMYNGDHFMRKYMEISVPDDKKADAVIDYIDLESLKVNESDAKWTIPTTAGGIVQMSRFKANLGQPIYIQGMFFGCEFPAADNEIVDGTGYMRYYTGKSFERLGLDNQLTTDGKYVTWQTVAGAARSTDNAVIQADFFEYIKSIATPSEFRIQYNSWFDNMMLIDDQNILESFIEIDRELNQAEVRPLDSYVVDDGWVNYNNTSVVDANRAGTTLNESGFWEFNSKFPEGLTPSSELVHNFGSNFGVWVGPRGGYNFYGSLADILVKSGKGSKAGGSIDVADRTYVKNFTDMAVKWMGDYKVNYWKWDGFADNAQYSAFAAADGVPGYANRHMTGGYENMYHVTDLWEAWIDLMEAVRQCEKDQGINKLWISLTCYVNPSPWYLQWANSVWIQCTHDQNDAGSSSSKMDRQITYRDACYYDFLKNHQFQFPLSNIYNHDPVYGKEGTGMTKNTATDEQFKNYLYMLATRGTAFWELYYSDSIMTDGKYEVTGEFLEWAEKNYHMLKNSKMFGDSPNTGTVLGGSSNGTQNAYGYACFDGTDGIISVRNSATTSKSVTITFDRTLGVPENAGTLKYHLEHSYNLTADTETTGELVYGQQYTFTLQPDEVRILRVSKDGDTTAPGIARVYSDGANGITVKFNEKVNAGTFKVNGTEATAAASADRLTFHLTAADELADNSTVTVTAENVSDLAGNELTANQASFVYHKDNVVVDSTDLVEGTKTLAASTGALTGNNGFSVTAEVYTTSTGTVLAQGSEYEIGINEDGTAYFTLNGAQAVSKTIVNDGAGYAITGVKENNGILKIYINGELEGSGYKKENRSYEVQAADIVAGNDDFSGVVIAKVSDTALGYDAVEEQFNDNPEIPTGEQNWASGKDVTAKWTADNSNAAKGGDRPMSMVVDGTINTNNYGEFGSDNSAASSYLEVDLGEVRSVSKINLYRYWRDGRTYGGTVIALSENADFSEKTIVYNSDADNFHELGAGTDDTYAESADGKKIVLANAVNARYVRVYMHGKKDGSGKTNHVVELQVIGELPIPAADYSAVDAAIAAADSLTKSDYVDFSAVDAAVAAVVRGKDATEQAAVNAMASAIYQAIAQLEKKVTVREQLQAAITAAEALNPESYTADSIAAYNAIIAAAKVVLNDSGATDEALAAELAKVQAAGEVLVLDVSKKKAELNQAIQAATSIQKGNYTNGTWTAFQSAIAAAQGVYENASATADDVQQAIDALAAAQSALKEIVTLSEAAVTVAAPSKGNTAAAATVDTAANYTVESTAWKQGETALAADAVFEVGKAYTVTVTLAAKEDYAFASDVAAKINNETADATITDGKLVVTKTFEPVTENIVEITDTPDVTVVAPATGQAPANAVLSGGGVTTNANVTTENLQVTDDGAFSGKITAANSAEENAVFNVTGTTKLLMHFQLKTSKITGTQAIIGKMNKQYGLQQDATKLYIYGALSGGWHEMDYTLPTDDAWYEQWHDVVAIYNGTKFELYVDGNAASEPSTHAGRTGSLVADDASVFTIGYNAGQSGQEFGGQLKDVAMYVGDQVPAYEIAGKTADQIKTMFAEGLAGKTKAFAFSAAAAASEGGYSITNTAWSDGTAAPATFENYKDYTVTVTLAAGENRIFKADATAVLRTSSAVLSGANVTVSEDLKTMTITYTFQGEEHPQETLRNYLASDEVTSKGTTNEGENRKYTIDSWNAFVAALGAANTAVSNNNLTPAEYTTAKTNLETAIAGLKLAAENCECSLGNVTFADAQFDMEGAESIEITLGTPGYEGTSANCIKHKNAQAVIVYAIDGQNTAGAVLKDGKLTVTKAGVVRVKATVTLGDRTGNATATYTIISTANEEQKQDLSNTIDSATRDYAANKDSYTPDSYAQLEEALKAAEALKSNANATAEEVANAKQAIAEAIAALKPVEQKEPEDVTAAKASVSKALAAAKTIFDAGKKDYTDASWKAFEDAYKAASNAPANADAAALNALAAALTKAQAGLAKAAAPVPPVENGKVYDSGNYSYKVLSVTDLTAEVTALKNPALTSIKIYNTVSLGGKSFKITSVAPSVFKNNKKIKSVVIGKNVTTIGKDAFSGCTSLKKLTLGVNVKTIGKKSFYNCKKLGSIVVKGKAVKTIQSGAFKKTAPKMTVKMPKKLAKKQRTALMKKFTKAGVTKKAKMK